SSVKQAASQSSGQRINVGSVPSVQDNVQIQPQQSADSASTQTPSRVQSVQLGERDTGLEGGNLDKFHSRNTPLYQTHSDQAPLHSKQDANSSQESSVKQAALQSSEQSIHGEGVLPSVNMPSELQVQSWTNNTDSQMQNPLSSSQGMQQHLKEDVPDKPKIETPQQESVRDFVEKKFEETNKKIAVGKKPIANQEEALQKEQKVVQDKTLLGTATKNLVMSAGEGLLSTAQDINEAIKKLPSEPPIIFP
ncbi:MAG: hypothetical protein JNJ47_05230, partial [Alphaproteobacteria bacterium]|nr:hypothetical protein [Alphaproteobacteria bacterium]